MSTSRLAVAGLVAHACAACAPAAWQQAPHDRFFQRIPVPRLHAAPKPTEALDAWYAIDHAAVRPLSVAVNPGHYIDRAIGGPPPLDVNHFGQVLDSPWFTNRIGRRPMTIAEVQAGPNRSGGPADGPFVVIGGKVEGATPGLVIRDTRGVEFIVKFDPPAFPALSSGAELIATKILWAAGYYVPENYVLTFDLSRLTLDPAATTRGRFGETVPLTRERLNDLVSLVNPYPDGSIRALFSRHLPGVLLGPFSYRGQRHDDPNDLIPHERRRSLRGLWLFSAWLNNTDTRRANSMDVFIGDEGGLGYVRHYLLDFGDSLGSAGTKPKFPGQGYEARLDWGLIARSLFSAGLAYRYWLPIRRSPFRSVGLYEAQVFDPGRWRANLPNPAFDEATALDTYWAASIIAHFRPEHLAAIVDAADYTEPGAAAWVLRVLLLRQSKVLQHAFRRVSPLDRPTARGARLELVDLAARANLLMDSSVVRYRWSVASLDGQILDQGTSVRPHADLSRAIERMPKAPAGGLRPFLSVTWQRYGGGEDSPPMVVHVRVVDGAVLPVAIDRPVH